MTPRIDAFIGLHHHLSNFSNAPVAYAGLEFPNVECAFQAAKCANPADQPQFRDLTAGQAKRLGRRVRMRDDWERVKLAVMLEMLRQKFTPDRVAGQALLATGDADLVEGNDWGDQFWGCTRGPDGAWVGENHLGKLLMRVRAELREKT